MPNGMKCSYPKCGKTIMPTDAAVIRMTKKGDEWYCSDECCDSWG